MTVSWATLPCAQAPKEETAKSPMKNRTAPPKRCRPPTAVATTSARMPSTGMTAAKIAGERKSHASPSLKVRSSRVAAVK